MTIQVEGSDYVLYSVRSLKKSEVDEVFEKLFLNRMLFNSSFRFQIDSFDSFSSYIFNVFILGNGEMFAVKDTLRNSWVGSLGFINHYEYLELTYVMKWNDFGISSYEKVVLSLLVHLRKTFPGKQISLQVLSSNIRAIRFYEKLGFQQSLSVTSSPPFVLAESQEPKLIEMKLHE